MDICLSQIKKSFGGKAVFTDLSCRFPLGKTSCVMGPSGCGKTTLLRLLLGLETPDSGEISGVQGLKKSAVFQEDRLCEDMDPVANIRLTNPKLSREETEEGLRALGLGDCLTQPVGEFSGGMKRRTAILRALLADYDILLADEPFQGLDRETKLLTMGYFREKTAGRTVILVTHDADEMQFFSPHAPGGGQDAGRAPQRADGWLSLAPTRGNN